MVSYRFWRWCVALLVLYFSGPAHSLSQRIPRVDRSQSSACGQTFGKGQARNLADQAQLSCVVFAEEEIQVWALPCAPVTPMFFPIRSSAVARVITQHFACMGPISLCAHIEDELRATS